MNYIPAYRTTLVRDGRVGVTCNAAASAVSVFRSHLRDNGQEQFAVAMVNTQRQIIGLVTVAQGSLAEIIVHPRDVFVPAIVHKASAIIVGHNHPSGDPTPGDVDVQLTRRLVQAGEVLGIKLMDHLILGDGTDNYFSFQERRLI